MLAEKVQKLPEVGSELVKKAMLIDEMMARVEAAKKELMEDIEEFWTVREMRKAGLR
jgi:hypothetical protein